MDVLKPRPNTEASSRSPQALIIFPRSFASGIRLAPIEMPMKSRRQIFACFITAGGIDSYVRVPK